MTTDAVHADPTIIEIGDEVEVEFPDGSRDAFQIAPAEAGRDDRHIAADAPIASAVLGRRPGERVTVTTPAGVYSCTIIRREGRD